jgi:hypothetical protein
MSSFSEQRDDIDRIPKMTMEHLLLERQNTLQGWYAVLLDEEISRRILNVERQSVSATRLYLAP